MTKLYVPDTVQYTIKGNTEANQTLLELCEVAPLALLERTFEEGYWQVLWGTWIEFTLPYCVAYIRVIKNVMKHYEPWVLHEERQHIWENSNDPTAGYFLEYRIGESFDFHFTIGLRSTKEGSTCVLNPIGTKKVQIFEVTCKEGANENTFAMD